MAVVALDRSCSLVRSSVPSSGLPLEDHRSETLAGSLDAFEGWALYDGQPYPLKQSTSLFTNFVHDLA